MNKIKIFLLFFLFTFGCEKTRILEADLQSEEYIVVQSELKSDSLFSGVKFSRTLPLNEKYSESLAAVNNVEAYIKVNGVQVIPLHNEGNGLYKTLYDYKIIPGNTYELIGKVDGRSIYSKTYVPRTPEIVNAFYQNDFVITAQVKPHQNEAYGAVWVINNGSIFSTEANEFYSIETSANMNANINIQTQIIPEKYRTSYYVDQTFIKIYSFAGSFLNYFNTKGNNKPIDNSFIQGGGAVAWNVYGVNVIGLFIGMAESALVKPN